MVFRFFDSNWRASVTAGDGDELVERNPILIVLITLLASDLLYYNAYMMKTSFALKNWRRPSACNL